MNDKNKIPLNGIQTAMDQETITMADAEVRDTYSET